MAHLLCAGAGFTISSRCSQTEIKYRWMPDRVRLIHGGVSYLKQKLCVRVSCLSFLGRFRSHVSKQSWLDLARPRQYLIACARYIFTIAVQASSTTAIQKIVFSNPLRRIILMTPQGRGNQFEGPSGVRKSFWWLFRGVKIILMTPQGSGNHFDGNNSMNPQGVAHFQGHLGGLEIILKPLGVLDLFWYPKGPRIILRTPQGPRNFLRTPQGTGNHLYPLVILSIHLLLYVQEVFSIFYEYLHTYSILTFNIKNY